MIGLNFAASLAAAFSSRDSAIERLAKKKLESAGQSLINRLVRATPLGAAFSAMQVADQWLDTGESTSRVGKRWVRSALPRQGGLQRIISSFADLDERDPRGRRTTGRRWVARSRQEWLNNKWRRDWRSQPRVPAGTDAGGEWMEGRLPYPVSQASVISRKQRQKRTRAIKAYKKRSFGRTRAIQTSWGKF